MRGHFFPHSHRKERLRSAKIEACDGEARKVGGVYIFPFPLPPPPLFFARSISHTSLSRSPPPILFFYAPPRPNSQTRKRHFVSAYEKYTYISEQETKNGTNAQEERGAVEFVRVWVPGFFPSSLRTRTYTGFQESRPFPPSSFISSNPRPSARSFLSRPRRLRGNHRRRRLWGVAHTQKNPTSALPISRTRGREKSHGKKRREKKGTHKEKLQFVSPLRRF